MASGSGVGLLHLEPCIVEATSSASPVEMREVCSWFTPSWKAGHWRTGEMTWLSHGKTDHGGTGT